MSEDDPKRIGQLRAALAAGLIDPDTFDAAVADMQARLLSSSAIAQGPAALAVGAGGCGDRGPQRWHRQPGAAHPARRAARAGEEDLRKAYLARLRRQANQLPLFGGE